jgi:hypothetical protein
MSTTTIQQNIIYGLGEGALVADTTMLSYALRYANQAYRDIMNRYRYKCIQKRSVFRTSNGLSAYQMPDDFMGFLVVKDESGDSILDQVTPELFSREITSVQITDESFTSSSDTAVTLDQVGVVQYSETVTTTAGTTTYTRDTDYTMSYYNGQITMDSTGSMADATAYYIDYLYRATGSPSMFCVEFDSSNAQYVVRMDPVPDATKVVTLVYPAAPGDLSATVDAIWDRFEFAIERGGVYYGGLELIDDVQKRQELEKAYNVAIQSLIQLDQDLMPKHDRIPLVLKRNQYTNRTDWMN